MSRRADVTDGLSIRRRAATWRWVVSVVVAAACSSRSSCSCCASTSERSAGAVAAAVVTAFLAAAAVVVTWLESRRITRHLNRTIERLIDTESELRLLLDDLPEAVLSLDDAGVVRGANAKAAELTGHAVASSSAYRSPSSSTPTGGPTSPPGWPAGGRRSTPTADAAAAAARRRRRRRRSSRRRVDRPRQTDAGVIVRLRDVTEREERVRALEQARRRFQQAFHSAPTGMALVRLDDSTILDANRSLADMLAIPVDQLVGRSIREITHPDDLRAAASYRARLELGIADTYLLDQRYLRSDGEFVWARTRVAVTEDDGVSLAITHIEDVTEQRRTAERLQWAATHDDLTGLPNRTELIARVDAMLAGRRGRRRRHAVHRPRQLQGRQRQPRPRHRRHAAQRACRCGCARSSGRTPSWPASAATSSSSCCAHAGPRRRSTSPRTVRAAVRHAVEVEGTELFVSTSIGVSVNDREGVSAADLLRDADAAMYRAKARGRDCVEAFAPGTHETTVLALRTATELRRGIDRGEIVPYFQPIVELTTGHVTGFEALARWLHPERGLLAPDQFLPMAEETGLIDDIGASILRDSLAQFARWRARELPFADGHDLGQRRHPPARRPGVRRARRRRPRPDRASRPTRCGWRSPRPRCWPTSRRRRSPCATCAASACTSSVDDFGTGYSSLTYLKRFPVEAIKIDRAFVAGLGLDTEDTTIVEAVVNLGHSFGIAVDRRGSGDAAAAGPPAPDGLRPRPGLPLRPPPPGLHRRGRARRGLL